MATIEYLDDERKKLWAKCLELEEIIKNKSSEDVKTASFNSRKTAEFRNKTEERLSEAQNILDEFKAKNKSIIEEQTKIIQIFEEINEREERTIIKAETIEEYYEEFEPKISKLRELLQQFEGIEEKIDEIQNLLPTTHEVSKKISSLHAAAAKNKDEIDEIYYEIIGYTETDDKTGEEKIIAGTKDKLEKVYQELHAKINALNSDFKAEINNNTKAIEQIQSDNVNKFDELIKNWQSEYNQVLNQINELLPRALTTGLSYAYSDKKKEEVEERNKSQKTFDSAIKVMVVAGLIPFSIAIFFLHVGKTIDQIIIDIPRIVLAILPLYIPIFWVANSANKKVRLSKRLIEEYSHKETISKTFEGLSTQIDKMDKTDTSEKLMIRLLYNILYVNSENPGKLISDYNKSDHPLMEALDQSTKLSNIVEKLTNIPGLSYLANILERRNDKVFLESSKKINDGLDIVSKIENEN